MGALSRVSAVVGAVALVAAAAVGAQAPAAVTKPLPEARRAVTVTPTGVARYAADAPGANTSAGSHVVALTFDDGPDPTWTPQVLDILARKGVPATFFEIGRQIAAYPDITRSVAAAGHVVSNHTWSHQALATLPDWAWPAEVDRTTSAIAYVTGQRTLCVRPPYGSVNSSVVSLAAQRGLATMTWSIDPQDWSRPGTDAIVARVLGSLQDGAVALLHDGGGDRSQTIAALPRIIDAIRAQGYGFVTVCDPSNGPEQQRTLSFGAATPSTDVVRSPGRLIGGAPTAGHDGFWTATDDGAVYSHAGATYHGGANQVPHNRPIVAMAASPVSDGYLEAAADGGVYIFGTMAFHGSAAGVALNSPIVAAATTPDGDGYWLVAADGGVFAFGSAGFFGAPTATRLNSPVVGMAPARDGRGYWLAAADGGIFAYGSAAFYGSTGALHLNSPITSMAATSDGRGYWLGAGDGGVFTFGSAGFLGAGSSAPTALRFVALIDADRSGAQGYWMVGQQPA